MPDPRTHQRPDSDADRARRRVRLGRRSSRASRSPESLSSPGCPSSKSSWFLEMPALRVLLPRSAATPVGQVRVPVEGASAASLACVHASPDAVGLAEEACELEAGLDNGAAAADCASGGFAGRPLSCWLVVGRRKEARQFVPGAPGEPPPFSTRGDRISLDRHHVAEGAPSSILHAVSVRLFSYDAVPWE